MSFTRHGSIVPGTFKVSPGATTEFSRTGLSTRNEVWIMNTPDIFTLSPKPNTTFHPDFPNLLCTSSVATNDTLNLSSVALTFEGFAEGEFSEPLPPPVYTLSGVPFTAPADTMDPERWQAVKDYVEANFGIEELRKAFRDEDINGQFEQFPNNVGRYSGGSDYQDGNLYWQVDYLARTSQRGMLSRYQLIDTPMGSAWIPTIRRWWA